MKNEKRTINQVDVIMDLIAKYRNSKYEIPTSSLFSKIKREIINLNEIKYNKGWEDCKRSMND